MNFIPRLNSKFYLRDLRILHLKLDESIDFSFLSYVTRG